MAATLPPPSTKSTVPIEVSFNLFPMLPSIFFFLGQMIIQYCDHVLPRPNFRWQLSLHGRSSIQVGLPFRVPHCAHIAACECENIAVHPLAPLLYLFFTAFLFFLSALPKKITVAAVGFVVTLATFSLKRFSRQARDENFWRQGNQHEEAAADDDGDAAANDEGDGYVSSFSVRPIQSELNPHFSS